MKELSTKHYLVGDHRFAIRASEQQLNELANYAPFITDESEETDVFITEIRIESLPDTTEWDTIYIDKSDDDMPRVEIYRRQQEWLFCLSQFRDSDIVCTIHCSADMQLALVTIREGYFRFAVDNATMLLYAFRTAALGTLLFHSSVTVLNGMGYMFLGHSGTGKSTHSQQWKKAFPEAWLLNDDNPVVRVFEDGAVHVYGSPWSGKTPCYKQNNVPVKALVQLEQAPENKIRRLRMTHAYPYILSSVSGLKLQPESMDSIYESIAALLERVPVCYLECLPNEEAAHLCFESIQTY